MRNSIHHMCWIGPYHEYIIYIYHYKVVSGYIFFVTQIDEYKIIKRYITVLIFIKQHNNYVKIRKMAFKEHEYIPANQSLSKYQD